MTIFSLSTQNTQFPTRSPSLLVIGKENMDNERIV